MYSQGQFKMTKLKIKAINAVKSEIASDLIVEYIIDYLVEVGVFTEDEKNAILHIGRDLLLNRGLRYRNEVLRCQSECFLKVLVKKIERNDFAFNAFLYILSKDGNYPWLRAKIEREFSFLVNNQKLLEMPELLCEFDSTPDESSTKRSRLQLIDPLTLSDIKGYGNQIRQLKDLISPFMKGQQRNNTKIALPKTVLLFGPMGTGKTSICKALCFEFTNKMFCIYVNCGTIMTKKLEDTKKNIISIFKNANQKSRSLVVLDNCEIICSKKDNALVAVLGSLLNDLPKNKHIVVILITNKLDMIDDCLRRPGIIDREIEIKYPNRSEMIKIFKHYLKGSSNDINDFDLIDWILHSEKSLRDFTGADIELICKEANLRATKSCAEINMDDLQWALELVFATKKRRINAFEDKTQITKNSPKTTNLKKEQLVECLAKLSESELRDSIKTSPEKQLVPHSYPVSLSGPPGSCEKLLNEAKMMEIWNPSNYLSIDLSPENSPEDKEEDPDENEDSDENED